MPTASPTRECKYNTNLPEVMDALAGLRKVANQYNAVLIGETWTDTIEKLKSYYGPQHDRFRCRWTLRSPNSRRCRQASSAITSPAWSAQANGQLGVEQPRHRTRLHPLR